MQAEILYHALDRLVEQHGADRAAAGGHIARPVLTNARQHLLEVEVARNIEGDARAEKEVGNSLVCLRAQTSTKANQLLARKRKNEPLTWLGVRIALHVFALHARTAARAGAPRTAPAAELAPVPPASCWAAEGR